METFYLCAVKVEQTWEKLETLQHLPLLAEIHHQVTHVVAGFSLQGQTKGWSHCHAVDKETHRERRKHTGWKQAMSHYSSVSEGEKKNR